MKKFIVINFGDWNENILNMDESESMEEMLKGEYWENEMENVSVNNGLVWDGNSVEDEFGCRVVCVEDMEYGVLYDVELKKYEKKEGEKIGVELYEFYDMDEFLLLSDDYELMVRMKVEDLKDGVFRYEF